MRIVLAASIYPPEIGGPAHYAAALKDALEKQGHDVVVCVFSAYRRLPSGIRHAAYMLELFRAARCKDAIIAFDVLTTGLPAVFAGMFARVPVVARVGGDFVWESYVERTHDLLPLPRFYEGRKHWGIKERFLFLLARWVLRRVYVVFTTSWLRGIWARAYAGELASAPTIENALPARSSAQAPHERNFLMYGRQVALKNAVAFRRAFERARRKHPDIKLEEGVVSKEELERRIRSSYALVVPSISEVSPNAILDAIRFGKPFLLTKYSGYAEKFGGLGVIVDPLDEGDMQRGVEELANPTAYGRLSAGVASFRDVREYADIAREFAALFEKS